MTTMIRWVPRNTVAPSMTFRPAMDVVENEDAVSVRLDLPGLSPDDISIEVEGDVLTISAERAESNEQENAIYHARERRTGAFKRSLRLADTLDSSAIQATYENGVLNLMLPKAPEAQPKRIKVETA